LKTKLSRHNFSEWCQNPDRETLVMGIINVTPDSFSDGGKYFTKNSAVNHAMSLKESGVTLMIPITSVSRSGFWHHSEKLWRDNFDFKSGIHILFFLWLMLF
jgi:hypothetical protein